MTCRTHGIRTAIVAASGGGLVLLGLFAAAGCTRNERTTTARSAARSAAQFAAASVTTTAAGQSTTPSRRSTGVKLNGNGGFDASEAQKAALAQAYYWRDHHNDVIKLFRPTTQPTTPATGGALTPFTGH